MVRPHIDWPPSNNKERTSASRNTESCFLKEEEPVRRWYSEAPAASSPAPAPRLGRGGVVSIISDLSPIPAPAGPKPAQAPAAPEERTTWQSETISTGPAAPSRPQPGPTNPSRKLSSLRRVRGAAGRPPGERQEGRLGVRRRTPRQTEPQERRTSSSVLRRAGAADRGDPPPASHGGRRCPCHRRVLRRPNSGTLSGATARALRTRRVAAPAHLDPRPDARPDRLDTPTLGRGTRVLPPAGSAR